MKLPKHCVAVGGEFNYSGIDWAIFKIFYLVMILVNATTESDPRVGVTFSCQFTALGPSTSLHPMRNARALLKNTKKYPIPKCRRAAL